LALVYIVVFGALFVGLIGFVYRSASSSIAAEADRVGTAELAILRLAYADAGRSGVSEAIARRLGERSLEGFYYLLTDSSLAPIAGNLSRWPPELKGVAGQGELSAADDRPLRATFDTLPDGGHLLVGQDFRRLEAFTRRTQIVLAVSSLLLLVLAGVASVTVTRRTVGRIEAINSTSRAIMSSGLGARIPLRGARDEWDELAANLNSMLDRIESLMAQVKQITDNVAHDLRTPLARMRGRLERAQNIRCSDEHQALIATTLADLDGVLRMFASLIRISQIEARDRTSAFRDIDLVLVAKEVAELFDAAAEDRGARLLVCGDPNVHVPGDRDLLFDALANLVDNAIKHGREGGQVHVGVRNSETGAVVSIADDGPGIPVNEFRAVFQRFHRLERSRGAPGNGLGLSLVAAVAQLHAAQIEMADNHPGLKIQLRFPTSDNCLDARPMTLS
jgi:signal transduction histidine kinase